MRGRKERQGGAIKDPRMPSPGGGLQGIASTSYSDRFIPTRTASRLDALDMRTINNNGNSHGGHIQGGGSGGQGGQHQSGDRDESAHVYNTLLKHELSMPPSPPSPFETSPFSNTSVAGLPFTRRSTTS